MALMPRRRSVGRGGAVRGRQLEQDGDAHRGIRRTVLRRRQAPAARGADGGAVDVAVARALLDAQRPAVNSAMLIGHRAIRAAVMGIAPRAAMKDEIAQMEVRLEAALAEGGAGASPAEQGGDTNHKT